MKPWSMKQDTTSERSVTTIKTAKMVINGFMICDSVSLMAMLHDLVNRPLLAAVQEQTWSVFQFEQQELGNLFFPKIGSQSFGLSPPQHENPD